MQVDHANRLVADSLEADWNVKLRALGAAQEEYQRQRPLTILPHGPDLAHHRGRPPAHLR